MKRRISVLFIVMVLFALGSTASAVAPGFIPVGLIEVESEDITLFDVEKADLLAYLAEEESRYLTPIDELDFSAFIPEIENGTIMPLSASKDEYIGMTGMNLVDEMGNVLYEVDLDTMKIDFSKSDSPKAIVPVPGGGGSLPDECEHEYLELYGTQHYPATDGSCEEHKYNVLSCTKCGEMWLLDLVNITYWPKCPH